MYLMALAIAHEMARFPGGPKALAEACGAARPCGPLRWPADRLDTLGGYLTYHNVTLLTSSSPSTPRCKAPRSIAAVRTATRSSRSSLPAPAER